MSCSDQGGQCTVRNTQWKCLENFGLETKMKWKKNVEKVEKFGDYNTTEFKTQNRGFFLAQSKK
jgi:hypothetical protein